MKNFHFLLACSFCFLIPALASAQSVFWTEVGAGNIDSTGSIPPSTHSIATGLASPYGIALDSDSGRVYWSDVTDGQIWRSNRNGTNAQLLLSGLDHPRGIAIDEAARTLYWVENGSKKIRRANIDGTSPTDILTAGLLAPTQIAIDPVRSRLYWTDNGGSVKHIGTCGTNGSGLAVIDSTTAFVFGIAVDTTHLRLYWTEYGTAKRIRVANLDGSTVTTIDSFTTSNPRGIFVSATAGKIFWTDYISNQVEMASLSGSGEAVLASGLNNPLSISGFNSAAVSAVSAIVGVPNTYALEQNYPNPFNPSTTITYDVPRTAVVRLAVYDLLGRMVTELVNGEKTLGEYHVEWNADKVSSGIYYVRMETQGFVATRKLILMK